MNKQSKKLLLQVCKYVCKMFLMYGCALLGIFCYGGGFATHITIMMLCALLVYVGYITTRKIIDMLFLYSNLLLSVYIGSMFATRFYYEKVSSDDMSLVIGNIFTLTAFIVTVVLSGLSIVVRVISIKKGKM